MLERVLRIENLHDDAKAPSPNPWRNTSRAERLAAVEAIRRATLNLYGSAVHGVERILTIAEAPSRSLRAGRRARGGHSCPAATHE